MDFEKFYRDLENRPAPEVTACMQRIVSMVKRRAFADPQSFAKSATPSSDAAIINADKVARDLRKSQIAQSLWTHQAVWSKFSPPGAVQPPACDLVKATALFMAQPQVARFIASLNLAVENEMKTYLSPAHQDKGITAATDRSSGECKGSEEHKQPTSPMLISNPASSMRDPCLDGRRSGGVAYPPTLGVPNSYERNGAGQPGFPDKHHASGGSVPGSASQFDLDRKKSEEHQKMIDEIAEQNRLRRAAMRQSDPQSASSFSHPSDGSRPTLPMPPMQNIPPPPYGLSGFTSPPRTGFSAGGPTYGHTNGTNGFNGTYSYANGNGKRPWDSTGQPSYGRGAGRDGARGGGGPGGGMRGGGRTSGRGGGRDGGRGGGRGSGFQSPGRPHSGRF